MSKYRLKHINKRKINIPGIVLCGLAGACCATMFGYAIGSNDSYCLVEEDPNVLLTYDELINCYLTEINVGVTPKLSICKRNLVDDSKKPISKVNEYSIYQYVDILTGDEVYNERVLSGEKFDTLDVVDMIRANDNIDKYLVNFNLVKNNYNKEDIKTLMSDIYSVYKYSGDNDIKYKIKQINK